MLYAMTLSVAYRETFDEIANRDVQADYIRSLFDQDKWMSDKTETFNISFDLANAFNAARMNNGM